MAEGARLESVYAGNRIEGSNPSPSANVTVLFSLISHIQDSGQMPVQFEFELATLFGGISDNPVDQTSENGCGLVSG